MKRLLPISLLTLCFAAISQEQASAWINSRFGIGLNWSWQSGGNNLLWGLFRDGQPPAPCPIPGCQPPLLPGYPMPGGPMMGGPMPGFGGPGLGGPGFAGPGCAGYPFPGPPPVYGTQDFIYFGRNNTPSTPGASSHANVPQTAQNTGYNNAYQSGYSPAAQQAYYPNYAPQYPYGYYPWYRR